MLNLIIVCVFLVVAMIMLIMPGVLKVAIYAFLIAGIISQVKTKNMAKAKINVHHDGKVFSFGCKVDPAEITADALNLAAQRGYKESCEWTGIDAQFKGGRPDIHITSQYINWLLGCLVCTVDIWAGSKRPLNHKNRMPIAGYLCNAVFACAVLSFYFVQDVQIGNIIDLERIVAWHPLTGMLSSLSLWHVADAVLLLLNIVTAIKSVRETRVEASVETDAGDSLITVPSFTTTKRYRAAAMTTTANEGAKHGAKCVLSSTRGNQMVGIIDTKTTYHFNWAALQQICKVVFVVMPVVVCEEKSDTAETIVSVKDAAQSDFVVGTKIFFNIQDKGLKAVAEALCYLRTSGIVTKKEKLDICLSGENARLNPGEPGNEQRIHIEFQRLLIKQDVSLVKKFLVS